MKRRVVTHVDRDECVGRAELSGLGRPAVVYALVASTE